MEPNTNTTTSDPQKSNTMMFVIGIVVLLLIGVGIVFAMNNNAMQPQEAAIDVQPSAMEEQQPTVAETTTEPSGAMMEESGEVKEFTITGKNFSFSPSTIRVKQGDTVKITFKNTGGFHDFVIDEFDIKTAQIQDGESETVEFVADKKGTFDYYCSVGTHRQNGMEGKVIVE